MTDNLLRASILKDQMLDLAAFAKESSDVIDQLKNEIQKLRSERDNLIKINRTLRDRPDLGDRALRMDELIRENERLHAIEAAAREYYEIAAYEPVFKELEAWYKFSAVLEAKEHQ